ncbi:50S ribosomal protein L10 [Candidatus Micrarchaeota archaeon]|nr:50S ribosomal protein L10 [Candidatus Micrarchaeota archaeon]
MVLSKEKKEAKVAEIKDALSKHPVVAVATLQNLPSRQYNAIKKMLRGKASIIVARATLLQKAIKEGRPELEPLAASFKGSTALIVSDLNPFSLFAAIKQNRSKTAAKPGQIAPFDLVVPAGETSLAPGPVLTELKQAGISAKIQGPKVVIDRDSTVVKKDAVINETAAKILAKLGVQPMEIGLTVLSAFENGTVYPAEILDVDQPTFIAKIQLAHRQALNVGVFAEIFNAATTPLIIGKASRAANAVKAAVDSKSGAEAQPAMEGASAGGAAPEASAQETAGVPSAQASPAAG